MKSLFSAREVSILISPVQRRRSAMFLSLSLLLAGLLGRGMVFRLLNISDGASFQPRPLMVLGPLFRHVDSTSVQSSTSGIARWYVCQPYSMQTAEEMWSS